jgi:hypothetical protein
MKDRVRNLLAALAIVIGATTTAFAVTLNVSPSAVSNTYNGYITLQIGGLTNGASVVVQKYLDANTNGVVDAGDWLLEQFNITDGRAGMVIGGVTNLNVPKSRRLWTWETGTSRRPLSGNIFSWFPVPPRFFRP